MQSAVGLGKELNAMEGEWAVRWSVVERWRWSVVEVALVGSGGGAGR